MKIEMAPSFKFSNDEAQAGDSFCALCDDVDREMDDCWDYADVDDIKIIVEENIMMEWQKFYEAVQRFTSFVHDHREG